MGNLYKVNAVSYTHLCFVAKKNTLLIREETLKQIEAHLHEIIKLAASCGLEKHDSIEMLNLLEGE